MPFIKSLVFKHCTLLILIIILLSEIMLLYSCYIKKKLLYIAITAPSSYQLFFYFECTKVNIYSLYNVHLVFNNKYTFYALLYPTSRNTW